MDNYVRFLVAFDSENDKEILNEKLYEEGIDYDFDNNDRYIINNEDSDVFIEEVEKLGFYYEMI